MSGFWIVAPPVPLIEPIPAQEVLVDGIGGIYYSNGNVLIPFYKEETPLEAPDAPPQRIVKVKLFGPISAIPESIGILSRCLWRRRAHDQILTEIPTAYPGGNVRRLRK